MIACILPSMVVVVVPAEAKAVLFDNQLWRERGVAVNSTAIACRFVGSLSSVPRKEKALPEVPRKSRAYCPYIDINSDASMHHH